MQRVQVSFTCAMDAATGGQLQKAADEILIDLTDSPHLLADTDFPLDWQVSSLTVAIDDRSQGTNVDSGMDLVVNLAVHVGEGVVARIAAAALMSWWRETLKPRLLRRVGDDAIGPDEAGGPQVSVEPVPTPSPPSGGTQPLTARPTSTWPVTIPEVDVRMAETPLPGQHPRT